MVAPGRFAAVARAAEHLWDVLPGYRVEILQGRLTATPFADGGHAQALTGLGSACERAGTGARGLHGLQGIGLWLHSGPHDYAVPDFAVVEDGFLDAMVRNNCYAPSVFRLVLEVTCVDWSDALGLKAECYAESGVPVYVVVDRKHDRVLVLADPDGKEYRTSATYKRGAQAPLPASVGLTLDLDVATLLDGGA